jgi:hypothetical protein
MGQAVHGAPRHEACGTCTAARGPALRHVVALHLAPPDDDSLLTALRD